MANIGYIQVTRFCNQECRFCSNPERKISLPFAKGKKYIDDFVKKNYISIMLTGGEPTLNEELPKYIKYCEEKKIQCKMITNGQKTADMDFLKELIDAGLKHICLSIHSIKKDLQAFITNNQDSLKNVLKTLNNLSKFKGLAVDILTTINKYNANHLSEIVKFLENNFPFIYHYTWNNLDPRMNRASKNTDTIPKLGDFEFKLYLAMKYLDERKKKFQVERVPLCYMTEYAHTSTETRRIVKEEERGLYFLDERKYLLWNNWEHKKAECCKICSLNEICAGLHEMGTYYSAEELYPVFVNKEKIIKKILNGES